MRQDSISVMTVPATDETTAALTDWLLRELLPLMFAGAGLRCPASTLHVVFDRRGDFAFTHGHYGRRSALRKHDWPATMPGRSKIRRTAAPGSPSHPHG